MLKKILNKIKKTKITNIDELKTALNKANKTNIINFNLHRIISGTLQTANLKAKDVMIPKPKMVVIKENTTFKECLQIIVTSAHSRFPVIDDNYKVKGVILAKDLLAFINSNTNKNNFNYRDYLREPIIIPEEKTLESLISFFQQKRSHLMIVVDEYGETTGIITLEDVLEQIVGEITDEHDFEKDDIVDYGNNRYLVRGNTPLSEFNKYFNTNFYKKDSESIAGFLVKKFGYMPKQLEKTVINNYHFKILKSSDRRVILIEVIKK